MHVREGTFTTSDGFEIFHRTAAPRKPLGAVMFLHGLAMHTGLYLEAIERLGKAGYFVIAPDQRGRGRSVSKDWKKGDVRSIPRMVDDTLELKRKYDDKISGLPYFICGISFGAVLAMLHVKSTRAAGLVMAGPPFGAYTRITLAAVQFLSMVMPNAAVESLEIQHISTNEGMKEKLKKDPPFVSKPIAADIAAELVRSICSIEKGIGSVQIPALIMYGSIDKIASAKQIEKVIERWANKDCKLVVIEGNAHDIWNDSKDRVLAEVIAWMKEKGGANEMNGGKKVGLLAGAMYTPATEGDL